MNSDHVYVTGMMLIVPLLGLFALGILAYVLLRSREGKFSLGGFFSLIFSVILVLPVVAVMAWLFLVSGSQFTAQPATIEQSIEDRELIDTSSPSQAAESIPFTTSTASVQSGSILRVWVIILPLMGLIAFAIMAYVLLKSREGKFSLGGFFSLIFSAILVLPVLAVMTYLMARSAPQLVEQSEPIDLRIEDRDLIDTSSPVNVTNTIPVTTSATPVERDPNLPEWVGQPDVVTDEIRLVSLSSQQYSSIEEAEGKILQKAKLRIQQDFHKTYSYKGDWAFPEGVVENYYLGEPYVENLTRSTENRTFEMVRVHRRLTLSPEAHKNILYSVWRAQIVERRLWTLGSLLGVFTLVLGSMATYLRLDAATSGAYRIRLKLATVALIVAGGMGVAMMLPVG